MSNIVPGCLARVESKRPENNGLIVRVYGEYLHNDFPDGRPTGRSEGTRLWRIDTPLAWGYVGTGVITGLYPVVTHGKLRRIDDWEQGSWEELKNIWKPEREIA